MIFRLHLHFSGANTRTANMLFGVFCLLISYTATSAELIECAVFRVTEQVPLPTRNSRTQTLVEPRATNATVPCDSGYCYALWQTRANGSSNILKKGCWMKLSDCDMPECTDALRSRHYRHFTDSQFCCCSGNLCNVNVSHVDPPRTDPSSKPPPARTPYKLYMDAETLRKLEKWGLKAPILRLIKAFDVLYARASNVTQIVTHYVDPHYKRRTIIIALVSVSCLTILIILAYLVFRVCSHRRLDNRCHGNRCRARHRNPVVAAFPADDLQLSRLLSSGRFGQVWKATLKGREVAVKLYTACNYKFYRNEREIYTLPYMVHDNLLQLQGSGEYHPGCTQYILVLHYYPHGALTSYLRTHDLDFLTLCRMCLGIASGLAHLHTDVDTDEGRKPPVAHRDLNSRNILVRPDLSCVIADFGLSVTTAGSKVIHDGCAENAEESSLTDVGTLRYMAPEVLEGAVNLRDCESSLKQIDVYSLSLVMWEVASRCRDLYPTGHTMGEYELPYAALTGPHPTFEDMKTIVCIDKLRPAFPPCWQNNQMVSLLRETIDESWDTDGDARLTALCIQNRVGEIALMWNHDTLSGPDTDAENNHYSEEEVESHTTYDRTPQVDTRHLTPCLSTLCQIVPPNAKVPTSLIHDSERSLPQEILDRNNRKLHGCSAGDPASLRSLVDRDLINNGPRTNCERSLSDERVGNDASSRAISPDKTKLDKSKSKLSFMRKSLGLRLSGLAAIFRRPKIVVSSHTDARYVGLESGTCSPEDNATPALGQAANMEMSEYMEGGCDNDAEVDRLLSLRTDRTSECGHPGDGEPPGSRVVIAETDCAGDESGACVGDEAKDRDACGPHAGVQHGGPDRFFNRSLHSDKFKAYSEFNHSQDSNSDVLSSISDDYERIKTGGDYFNEKRAATSREDDVGVSRERLSLHRDRFDSARLTDSQHSLSSSSYVESVNSSDSQYSATRHPPSYTVILKQRFAAEQDKVSPFYSPRADRASPGGVTYRETAPTKAVPTRLSLCDDRVMCTKAGGDDHALQCFNSSNSVNI